MACIKEGLMNLYLNKNDDADITFLIHGTEFKAHKNILSVRSDVLKAMIHFGEKPADGHYPIYDPIVSPDVFKEFIKFLYLDECDVDYSNLGPLLHIGEMYNVALLKAYCVEFARQECATIAGAIQIGEIGIQYEKECSDLLRCTYEAVGLRMYDTFCYTSQLGNNLASKELVQRIAQECPRTIVLSEDTLLLKIFNWCKKKCEGANGKPDAESLKAMLAGFLRFLKLKNLSNNVMVNVIHKNGLLPPDQYIENVIDRLKEQEEVDDSTEDFKFE